MDLEPYVGHLREVFGPSAVDQMIQGFLELVNDPDLPEGFEAHNCWFFQLGRKLMVPIDRNFRKGAGAVLVPFAHCFVEVIQTKRPLTHCKFDPACTEEVAIAFEAAWSKIHFAEGEDDLSAAIQYGKQFPSSMTPHLLSVVVSMAEFLTCRHPGKEFFIPVNDDVATRLGVSKMHLSNTLNVAIDRGYLMVVRESVANKKARRLLLGEIPA